MPEIVGITGLISSGKDTVADYLCNHHNFTRLSFAGALKDAVSVIFSWDRELLEGNTSESRVWREEVDQWWADRLDIPHLTPRWVLQYWGTEVCRTGFHEDIWIASLENKLRKIKSNVVISDCRYPNELTAIKQKDGKVIRIERGPKPAWYQHAVIYSRGPDAPGWDIAAQRLKELGAHSSEYSSVGFDYDYIIENNGTINELHQKIKSIINL